MIILGITGSIATGKTFISGLFKDTGVLVFNYDDESHKILKEGRIKEIIADNFPECYQEGIINRNILGNIVFSDPEKLKLLESVLHPELNKKRDLFIKENQNQKILVIENQLIYETNDQGSYDLILVTYAEYKIQKSRVLKRKNMSLEKFNNIYNIQEKSEYKIKKADFIVDTGVDSKILKEKINILYNDILNNNYTNNCFYKDNYFEKNNS